VNSLLSDVCVKEYCLSGFHVAIERENGITTLPTFDEVDAGIVSRKPVKPLLMLPVIGDS